MKKIFHVAFLACLTFSASLSPAPAWTNDLRITSITRVEDCTTLTWRSHPGEFYTVLWADELRGLNTFWRVAEVNVPSGGTNTNLDGGRLFGVHDGGGGRHCTASVDQGTDRGVHGKDEGVRGAGLCLSAGASQSGQGTEVHADDSGRRRRDVAVGRRAPPMARSASIM